MGVKKLIEALENSIRRSIDRNKLENLFQSAIEQLYRVERGAKRLGRIVPSLSFSLRNEKIRWKKARCFFKRKPRMLERGVVSSQRT